MVKKGAVPLLKRGIFFFSQKRFLAHCRDAINSVATLLDQGKSRTAVQLMKETIDLCEERAKKLDKEGAWFYATACCLYNQSLMRFGKKGEEKYFEKALSLAKENEFNDVYFCVYKSKFDYAVICGRNRDVQECHQIMMEYSERIDDAQNCKAQILPALAWHALSRGDFDSAKQRVSAGLETANKINNINLQVKGLVLLGRISLLLGNNEDAVAFLEKAVVAGQKHQVEQQLPAHLSLAELYIGENKNEEAKRHMEKATQMLNTVFELSDAHHYICLNRLKGLLEQQANNLDQAEEYYNRAINIAQKQDNVIEEGVTCLQLGQLYIQKADYKKATIALEDASAKFIIADNEYQLEKAKAAQSILKDEKETPSCGERKTSSVLYSQQQIAVLDDFIKHSISNLDLNTVLNNVIEHIMKATEADRGFIVLIDESGKLYSHVTRTKGDIDKKQSVLFKNYSRSITEKVLETKSPIFVADIQADSRFATAESISGLDIRSAVCVPVRKGSQEIMGLIYIDRQAFVGAFTADDLSLVESLGEYAAIAIQNASLHDGVQKKLRDAEVQLIQSEKMATVGMLAGGVAHEINTPLGSILMNVQMMQKKISEDSLIQMLNIIEASTKQCRDIVNLLLQYSRKADSHREEVDINQVINRTCSFLEHQLAVEQITIKKELSPDVFVIGNFNELMQVFTNLIINAKQAIKTVRSSGTIFVKSFREENTVFIQVIDDGEGIAREHIDKIFDPFFTTREVKKGTGLGLSIVYKIIENHKGTIKVASTRQEGTTFTIGIPLKKEETAA